jgi:Zn-finger nucleic acid-binding protein
MHGRKLDGVYGRAVAIDACDACQGLWLDGFEALQLSPAGVLALVHMMDDPRGGARPPMIPVMQCPRCRMRLSPTQDRQRTTTFRYERCPAGHGRFITFHHFLRSRNFVRELSDEELRDLRSRVRSINCSNCGAPVDVARLSMCSYCQTPISTVEPGQIRAAIEELQQAADAREKVDPTLPIALLQQRAEVERAFRGVERDPLAWMTDDGGSGGLVGAVLRALISKTSR